MRLLYCSIDEDYAALLSVSTVSVFSRLFYSSWNSSELPLPSSTAYPPVIQRRTSRRLLGPYLSRVGEAADPSNVRIGVLRISVQFAPLVSDTPRVTQVILPKKTVLFICTANYYRSRFAEHLFNALADENDLCWQATSCGLKTWLVDGLGPVSEYTVERLATRGIQLDGEVRFPIPLTENDLVCADLVIAMKEAEHRAMMMERFPLRADCINYWHIDDIDCKPPEEALAVCEACVETLVQGLLTEQRSATANRRKLAA